MTAGTIKPGTDGGLGGYFPPLVMGTTYNAADQSYAIGLLCWLPLR